MLKVSVCMHNLGTFRSYGESDGKDGTNAWRRPWM